MTLCGPLPYPVVSSQQRPIFDARDFIRTYLLFIEVSKKSDESKFTGFLERVYCNPRHPIYPNPSSSEWLKVGKRSKRMRLRSTRLYKQRYLRARDLQGRYCINKYLIRSIMTHLNPSTYTL